MKRDGPEYSGILLDPIVLDVPVSSRGPFEPPTDEDWFRQHKRVADERYRRILALFNHYGIDPLGQDAWMRLALDLARDHVPGIQVLSKPKRRRGRPRRDAGPFRDLDLCIEIAKLRLRGHSARRACQLLAKGQYKGEAARTLERRYYGADSRTVKLAEYAVVGEAVS